MKKFLLFVLSVAAIFGTTNLAQAKQFILPSAPTQNDVAQAILNASEHTSVRVALLYGLYGQETSFGTNLGKTESGWEDYCANSKSETCDYWRTKDCKDIYGNAKHYDDVLRQLNYVDLNGNTDRTKIPTSETCALGLTQFEPNTWWGLTRQYTDRVYSPWDIDDAILMTAYQLQALGADKNEIPTTNEFIGEKDKIALQKYYCGGQFQRTECVSYADNVSKKSKKIPSELLLQEVEVSKTLLNNLQQQLNDLQKQSAIIEGQETGANISTAFTTAANPMPTLAASTPAPAAPPQQTSQPSNQAKAPSTPTANNTNVAPTSAIPKSVSSPTPTPTPSQASITPTQQTLVVSIIVNPLNGTAPLNNVSVKTSVFGTAKGTINYTFYCNRDDAGTNITDGWDVKYDGIFSESIIETCNYPNPGTYTIKVIAERGSAPPAEVRVPVNVTAPPMHIVTAILVDQQGNINPEWHSFWLTGGSPTSVKPPGNKTLALGNGSYYISSADGRMQFEGVIDGTYKLEIWDADNAWDRVPNPKPSVSMAVTVQGSDVNLGSIVVPLMGTNIR
jgi:hypothetical protein